MIVNRLLILLGLVLMVGCNRAPQPSRHDVDRAREILVIALDAWKQGQVETLAKREPPIRFVDDDWRAGSQLTNYALEEPHFPSGPIQDVIVVLTLKNQQGETQKTATYQVKIEPNPAVLRSDL